MRALLEISHTRIGDVVWVRVALNTLQEALKFTTKERLTAASTACTHLRILVLDHSVDSQDTRRANSIRARISLRSINEVPTN